MNSHEQISTRLYSNLITKYPEQCERVFNSKYCDIEPSFLGFVTTYYHLAKVVPTHFTIVDLGCAFAPQGYYFTSHMKYIGIDTGELEGRFIFRNTEHRVCKIEHFLDDWEGDTSEVFTICNYVPIRDTERIRSIFKNLYVFYPHGGDDNLHKKLLGGKTL